MEKIIIWRHQKKEINFKFPANYRSKSVKAEQEHLEHVFVCQNGGGDKGVSRHVQINKKVLVRDRLRRILDEDSDFFELSTTAGI